MSHLKAIPRSLRCRANKGYVHHDVLIYVVPLYQNVINLFFSLLFLVLYTITVNTPNDIGKIDAVEGFLFAFALGFFIDEVAKVYDRHRIELINRYQGGIVVLGFWNAYNV